jgi:drug/metabolite transporter (DMT)-like permease
MTALFFSVVGSAVVLWVITLMRQPLSTFATWGIMPYILAGVFVPFVARLFFIEGIRRLGAARNSFISGSQPLIATIFSIVLLGEFPSRTTMLGTFLIVSGVALLSIRSKEEQKKNSAWCPVDIVFPLSAGLMFASRDALVRGAMFTLNDPYVAATTAATTSSVILFIYLSISRRWHTLSIAPANIHFLIYSGLCAGGFYFFLFNALSRGSVATVSPLTATAPLFVLFYSITFMRESEPITRRLVAGGCMAMLGGFCITSL